MHAKCSVHFILHNTLTLLNTNNEALLLLPLIKENTCRSGLLRTSKFTAQKNLKECIMDYFNGIQSSR
jgi:hypothetical protein